MPKQTIERLHWALLGLVLACIAGAVPVIATDPVLAALVVAFGGLAAILGFALHRDPVLLAVTALIFPTIALGILALSLFLDVPLDHVLWAVPIVFAAVLVVVTARDPLEPVP